jgi:hypothetical protein
VALSPAGAVAGADVILTMLYDAAAVTEVIRQTAPGIRQGAAWVQSTTVGVNDVAALCSRFGAPLETSRGRALSCSNCWCSAISTPEARTLLTNELMQFALQGLGDYRPPST